MDFMILSILCARPCGSGNLCTTTLNFINNLKLLERNFKPISKKNKEIYLSLSLRLSPSLSRVRTCVLLYLSINKRILLFLFSLFLLLSVYVHNSFVYAIVHFLIIENFIIIFVV